MQNIGFNNMYNYFRGDSLDIYPEWPRPDAIISDGAYGIRGFEGDTAGTDGLPDWYLPHISAWNEFVKPSTTLWFWNTEIGWATVHPFIENNGWKYVQTITWDKGINHIAGNINGQTIRQYPVVTEICTLYQRKIEFSTPFGIFSAKDWLRYEWERSGIPLNRSNEACGVKNAATRKYLTKDWLWYWPPGDMVEKMSEYTNEYGISTKIPYFSLDGCNKITAEIWDSHRYTWQHIHGITNVWNAKPLHGAERMKGGYFKSAPRSCAKTNNSALHFNQKPLEFMRRIINSSTRPGDIIWEPFGGLASAAVAAIELARFPCVAEINPNFQDKADLRLRNAVIQKSNILNFFLNPNSNGNRYARRK